jgi:hypothetical protein
MRLALLFSCLLLLAWTACGCRPRDDADYRDTPWHQKEVTVRGVLRAPGSSTVAAPVTEWVVERPGEENKPVAVDISGVRDRAIELEGKRVKVVARTPAQADVESRRAPLLVKELEAD